MGGNAIFAPVSLCAFVPFGLHPPSGPWTPLTVAALSFAEATGWVSPRGALAGSDVPASLMTGLKLRYDLYVAFNCAWNLKSP